MHCLYLRHETRHGLTVTHAQQNTPASWLAQHQVAMKTTPINHIQSSHQSNVFCTHNGEQGREWVWGLAYNQYYHGGGCVSSLEGWRAE